MNCKLGPSLMCTNLMNVESDIKELDAANVDFYHIDIMDGNFVSNFTLGPDFVRQVRKLTNKPLDIHIMANNPEHYIELFAEAGADMISIHSEGTKHLQGALAKIRKLGLKSGVALNPETSIDVLQYVLDVTDYVCLMTVNPGFAGQKFIPAMYKKIRQLHEMIVASGYPIEIEVDGNIGEETIPQCKQNGAVLYVGGTSAVYKKGCTLFDNVQATRLLLQ